MEWQIETTTKLFYDFRQVGVRRHHWSTSFAETADSQMLKHLSPHGEDPREGLRCSLIQDKERTSAILVSTIAVHQAIDLDTEDLPTRDQSGQALLVVIYKHDKTASQAPSGYLKASKLWLDNCEKDGLDTWHIDSTLEQQYFLLNLRHQNAQRFVKDYRPCIKAREDERDFTISFLLPCYDLSSTDLANY